MLAATAETPAPIVILSQTKRTALLECFFADTLKKLKGHWGAEGGTTKIAGVTVADLVRDDLFVVNDISHRRRAARLTTRGAWFARTLARNLVREPMVAAP